MVPAPACPSAAQGALSVPHPSLAGEVIIYAGGGAPRPPDGRDPWAVAGRCRARFGGGQQDMTSEAPYVFSRTLPALQPVDVLVAGGGMAGFSAAVAAARQGASVLLVEQHADLGGTA